MKLHRILFACLSLASIMAADVGACTCECRGQSTVQAATAAAAVIVVGRVIERREIDPLSSCAEEILRVTVTQRLKGSSGSEVTFVRAPVGTGCDFKFPVRVGDEYLFFGYLRKDGTLDVSGCAPSAPLKEAFELLRTVRDELGQVS